jgi:hypothetical protein
MAHILITIGFIVIAFLIGESRGYELRQREEEEQ